MRACPGRKVVPVPGLMTATECLAYEARWLAARLAYEQAMAGPRAEIKGHLGQAKATGTQVPPEHVAAYVAAFQRAAAAFRQAMWSGPDICVEDYLRARGS